VQEVECSSDVLDYKAGLLFVEVAPLLDMVEERAALHLLKHHIELLLLLEELDDLENIRAVAAVQVNLNLLEHALAVRVPVLVDDLDGVLLRCVDVAACPDLAVGALAKHLTGQRVRVREAGGLHVGGEAAFFLLGGRWLAWVDGRRTDSIR